MTGLVVAIATGLLLVAADVFLITSAFLYNPKTAEWLIPGVLVTFAAAVGCAGPGWCTWRRTR